MFKNIYPKLKDEKWLRKKYVVSLLSAKTIAKDLECSRHAVYHALKKFKIERRKHTSKYPELNDKKWLKEKYIDEKLSTKQIADICNSTVGNVGSALVWMGIKLRSHKESLKTRYPKGRYGKKASNWKGGISELAHCIRTSEKYKIWRNEVFKRDNWTCRFCGGKGNEKNVDHIKQFAIILKENNITTIEDAMNCKELWDMSNGRTLCISCHKKTDTYSKRKY